MADISKCIGFNCPIKTTCYRYNAPEGVWQAYLFGTPYDFEKNECQYYWKDDEKEEKSNHRGSD